MKICFVVPIYNEEGSIPYLIKEIEKAYKKLPAYETRLILVDDGSKDKSLEKIRTLSENHDWIDYIGLSRNFGKESAMFAGLSLAQADYIGVIDADLQHPPALIPDMVSYLEKGYDVVATKRKSRIGASSSYKRGADIFYKIMNKFGDGVHLEEGVQDFRLMKKKVVDTIISMPENSRFSKGIFSWVGYDIKYLEVEDIKRAHGESKWSFVSSIKYALDGIFSFSTQPLLISAYLGFLVSAGGFAYAIYLVLRTLIYGVDVPGFATITSLILILGGLILFSLGLIGIYLGRIYEEVKERPVYIIKETSLE